MGAGATLRTAGRVAAAGVGIAALGYAAYAARTWTRYGHTADARPDEADALLDRFMPLFEVVERHHIDVAAPAAVTLAAAKEMKLLSLPLVRAIFAARTALLGAHDVPQPKAEGLVEQVLAM